MNPDSLVPPEAPWASAWAKSQDENGDHLPLWLHMQDSGDVAKALWDGWLPAATRAIVERNVGGVRLARGLAVFLAAGHDCGKISEEFSSQVPELRDRMTDAGCPRRPKAPVTTDDRRARPHGTISAVSLVDWMHDVIGGRNKVTSLATILAGHHGSVPDALLSELPDEGEPWDVFRREAWERLLRTSGLDAAELASIAKAGLGQPAQVVLSGFVIVCDWIASNSELFPYLPEEFSSDRAERALARLRLPAPWSPGTPSDDRDLFRRRFILPAGAEPRPVQLAAMEVARAQTEPALMIVEAPTGEGKTEAALAAAEILCHTTGAGGVTVALPTCATSDAMFGRTLEWLRRSVPEGEAASVTLTHGRAQFNDSYTGLFGRGGDATIRDVHDEGGRRGDVAAHWWLRTRKKGALADFTVGTIDQILFLALRSRHLMLRHLGAAGKVVVLDECHVADSYMQIYLDRTLEWLGALGVPVIALSATLTPERRKAMGDAYVRGRLVSGATAHPPTPASVGPVGYPVISTFSARGVSVTEPEASSRSSRVTVATLGDGPEDLVATVTDALHEGGCVAVVRNTVRRAQEAYRVLVSRVGADRVVLMHSRFIGVDRQHLERALVEQLGPPSTDRTRPHGLVVVATQVIEQSLDVDFDLMLSDVAPMDLLIQRIGRLHRHRRPVTDRPTSLRTPRLLITGMRTDEPSEPPVFDKGCVAVYGRSALLRTCAVMGAHLESTGGVLVSPDHIADLVSRSYFPDAVAPAGWESAWDEAERARDDEDAERRGRASVFLVEAPRPGPQPILGWNARPGGEAGDDQIGAAQVRDTEAAVEVVVVQRSDGRIRSLPWLDTRAAEPVDGDLPPDDELARNVARCTVSLPAWTIRGARGDRLIAELENGGMASWQNSHWLSGVLPLVLDESLTARVGDLQIHYDRVTGLDVHVH